MSEVTNGGGKSFFDGHKISSVQKRFLIIAAWAYVFDQMDVSNFGFVAPSLMKIYGYSMQQIASIGSYNMFGMCVGALFGGWLSDKIGRKASLLITIAIFSLSSLANAVFTDFTVFLIMRTLTGFGTIAMVTITMGYISEMMPAENRGKYQAITIACGTVGIPVMALLARVVIPLSDHGWRFVFLLGGVGIILLFFGSSWLKESPRWLVSKGRIEEAARVLDEIVPGAKLPDNAQELAKGNNSGYIETFLIMFSPSYLRRTITVFIVVFGATLGSFYLANFYPAVHTKMGFAQTIVLNVAFIGTIGVPLGDYLLSFISDKGGRKMPIVILFILFGSLFILQGLLSNPIPIAIIMAIKSLFASAAMTLAWTYLAESYPTHIRSKANGILFGTGRFIAIFGISTVPMVFASYGYFGVNLVNALFYIIPGLLVLTMGEKTARVSLENINPLAKQAKQAS